MSKVRVALEPYDEGMFEEFAEVVVQGSVMRIDPDDPEHARSMREMLAREDSVLMAVRDAGTGEFLGYCDVHGTDRVPWEVGIKLLERHWGRGIGYAALSEFIPLMASRHGQEGFVARIAPDNLASIRLFQKLGATPREVVRGMYMLDDAMVERFAERHPELVDGTIEEMAGLFGVEPRYLLGRELVFDVPAAPPEPERAESPKAPGRTRSPRVDMERFFASELADDLVAVRELAERDGSSGEFADAFARLREKWGL